MHRPSSVSWLGQRIGAYEILALRRFRVKEDKSTSVAEQDRLIGTWELNVAKSSYMPGPAPISEIRTYARGPHGVEGTIERRFGDGRSERIEYVAEYDREYPVTGAHSYDHLLLKRIDASTAEAVLSHAGKVYGMARRVIAQDGRTMTITLRTEGVSNAIVNVALFQKIEP